MSIIEIDVRSRTPIYQQLIKNIKDLAIKGELKGDSQLPSVRQLATELAINPNTIQKAYAELDRIGITYTLPGKGSFVNADLGNLMESLREEQLKKVSKTVSYLKDMGMTKKEMLDVINNVWGDEND